MNESSALYRFIAELSADDAGFLLASSELPGKSIE